MKKKIQALIREKDGLRGLVPARGNGAQDKIYGEYLNGLDPRGKPEVQKALAMSNDRRFMEFLDRVQKPGYRKISLQSIAKACNISLLEFTEWWGKASTQAAIIKAQTASLSVVEDMAQDARTVKAMCERCDGMTWIAAPSGLPKATPGYRMIKTSDEEELWIRNCPACTDGKVTRPGDSHSRDKLLEMSGLISKNKGASLVLNFGGAQHSSAVGDLTSVTMDLGDVIDITGDKGKP